MEKFEIKEPDMLLLIDDIEKRDKFKHNFERIGETLKKKEFIKQFNKLKKERNEKVIRNEKILSSLYTKYLLIMFEKYPLKISSWEGEPGADAYEYALKINNEYVKRLEERNIILSDNENVNKRIKELEKKIGIIKNTIPLFIEYYNIHKRDEITTCKLFDDFKINYECIKNHSYKTYEKSIHKYGYKLTNK